MADTSQPGLPKPQPVALLRSGGVSKGEQLQNFVEHSSLLDPPTENDGRPSSPPIPNWSPPAPDSTGSVMDSETLAYYRWALRAWLRQGRTSMSPSCETVSADEEPEDSYVTVLECVKIGRAHV